MERVQIRATKILYNLKNKTYTDRLKALKLPSLKSRRIRGDLIQTYKIFNCVDKLNPDIFFTKNPTNTTRNATNKVFIEQHSTKLRKYCFSSRVAPYWNSLPDTIKTAHITNSFKNQIDHLEWFKNSLYLYY